MIGDICTFFGEGRGGEFVVATFRRHLYRIAFCSYKERMTIRLAFPMFPKPFFRELTATPKYVTV